MGGSQGGASAVAMGPVGASGASSSGSGGQAGAAPGAGDADGPAANGTGIINGNANSNLRGTQGGKATKLPQISGLPTGNSGGSAQNPNAQGTTPPPDGATSSGSTSSGSSGGGQSSSASNSPSGQSGQSVPGGQPGSGSSSDISMQPPSQQIPGLMPSLNFQKGQPPPESVAKKRGRDWALPDASHESAPVSRPVVVECRADKLVILAEDGKTVSQEIPLQGKTADSVDELRTAVWAHMKTWGSAGRGLYWKPTLAIRVPPDGRARFDELKALLADSGLDVHESARTAAPPPPPKKRWWK